MPAEQPLTELTTRDVLLQVDRRLTLIEDDLRALDQKVEERFSTTDQKIDTQTNQLRQEMNAGASAADQKIDTQTNQLRQEMNAGFADLRKEMNTKFYWTLGVVLASWISTIGTLLLK